MNGRDTSLKDFLDPGILDSLALKINEVLEVGWKQNNEFVSVLDEGDVSISIFFLILLQTVKQVSPGKSVWLGETSSAFGGGAAGLSDTFAAGFMCVGNKLND